MGAKCPAHSGAVRVKVAIVQAVSILTDCFDYNKELQC